MASRVPLVVEWECYKRNPIKSKALPLTRLDYRNIEKDPSRCGGQPVVAGTRVRVATVLSCYRFGMTVEEIVQQYPGLRPADVHDALAFAYDHIAEIDADLDADEEDAVKAQYVDDHAQ